MEIPTEVRDMAHCVEEVKQMYPMANGATGKLSADFWPRQIRGHELVRCATARAATVTGSGVTTGIARGAQNDECNHQTACKRLCSPGCVAHKERCTGQDQASQGRTANRGTLSWNHDATRKPDASSG